VLFSYLWGADLVGFVKQAKPYGLFDRMKVGTLLFMDDLKALGADMPNNVFGQMRAPFFALEGALVEDFIKRYRARHNGEYPADWAIMGYEAMMVYSQAIKKAGSVEPAALIKAMEQGEFQLMRGKVTFRGVDHQGNVPSFIGRTVVDSRYPFKILADVSRVPAMSIWPTEQEVLASRKS
jgi:branched-chain amino acid transport system substrate-binding protein